MKRKKNTHNHEGVIEQSVPRKGNSTCEVGQIEKRRPLWLEEYEQEREVKLKAGISLSASCEEFRLLL